MSSAAENNQAGLRTVHGSPVPLLGVQVDAQLVGAYVEVRLRQRYKNAEPHAVEAVYTFPLPADATLSSFALVCEGRRLEGEVRAREEAFQAYDEALVQGHGAALLEQERPNVFTANVGNLLPHEETLVELSYLQRLAADEGSLRWMLPTLVAPRYVPGSPQGNRTAGGWADPTDRVPDADRITPPIGEVDYGLKMTLRVPWAARLQVESPSHQLSVVQKDGEALVTFAGPQVSLDRDVVVLVRGAQAGPLAGVLAHRTDAAPGVFALSVVPDLVELGAGPHQPQEVVFVVDTSGSMDGSSLLEAKAALRLCLRHLRQGDRFNIVEFNSTSQSFSPAPVPFDQRTLSQADRWIEALHATGGTELLTPLVEAVRSVGRGVVVLLTDGQVGNEQEILQAALAARTAARVYSFGIGTNVSDALLRDLARHTGGGVEFIHPGERIDEKVIGVFAKALAVRVSGVQARWTGLEVGELAPGALPDLVDGEPWTVFGRYPAGATGAVELTGTLAGAPFRLEVPVDLPERAEAPALLPLWAAERIRDLLAQEVGGRRAGLMKERITQLAVQYRVSSPYTSFLVVERRTGDRLVTGGAQTRVVPVNAPAGWAMFERGRAKDVVGAPLMAAPGGAARPPAPAAKLRSAMPPAPRPMAPPPAAPASFAAQDEATGKVARKGGGGVGETAKKLLSRAKEMVSGGRPGAEPLPPPAPPGVSYESEEYDRAFLLRDSVQPDLEPSPKMDPTRLLSLQLASGLWEGEHGPGDEGQLRTTTQVLLALYQDGITTSHPVYGAQVKKAVEALVALVERLAAQLPEACELALGVAWLVATGPRTRRSIEGAVRQSTAFAALAAQLGDEDAVRRRVGAMRP